MFAVLYHGLEIFEAEKPRYDGIVGVGVPCNAVFVGFFN